MLYQCRVTLVLKATLCICLLLSARWSYAAETEVSVAIGSTLRGVRERLVAGGLSSKGHAPSAVCIACPEPGGKTSDLTTSNWASVKSLTGEDAFYSFDITAAPDAVEGDYTLEFYDTVTTESGVTRLHSISDTLIVHVKAVVVTKVSFLRGSTGALVLPMVHAKTDIPVSADEWTGGAKNEPGAYTINDSPKIYVELQGPRNATYLVSATGVKGGVGERTIVLDASGTGHDDQFPL